MDFDVEFHIFKYKQQQLAVAFPVQPVTFWLKYINPSVGITAKLTTM